MFMFTLISVGTWGCASVPLEESSGVPPPENTLLPTIQVKDLAGQWQYEEASAVYPLVFDQEGKGTYEWKKGRFMTTSLSQGVWKGTWSQEENDREGGFELRLQPDLQSARGQWWYTRIGEDRTPLQPGGTFMLRRVGPGLNGQE